MGIYINPPNETKESWLVRNGILSMRNPPPLSTFEEHERRGERWIRHVNNGPFTAAGVMYSRQELEYCLEEVKTDKRPNTWILVKREALTPEVIGEKHHARGDY